ncbi:MAG: outer membrane beta-barrel protein [Parvibaculum sp.]|nr:outer membrane beta-barrel protein [Parvibaculum sp.]
MSSALSKAMIAFAMLATMSGQAFAEEAASGDQRGSVKDRPRPAYDSVGIRAGAFMVFPQAKVVEIYDDNIYATSVNETDDFITQLRAAVDVESKWSRHSLNFGAGVNQSLYADNTDENRFDWDLSTSGSLDVTRDTRLSAGLAYSQLHEDRGEPNAVPAAVATEPTPYTVLTGNAAFDQKLNRVSFRVFGSLNEYDYEDVTTLGGAVLDQDYRDRTEYVEGLRVGYSVTPDTNVFIQGTVNQREYDLQPPAVAVTRDSEGFEGVVGSEFRLSNLAQGTVYVGYQEQSYDNAAYSDTSGLSYGGNVEWYVTPLTTITFDGAATIEETTTAGASGFMQQRGGVRIDHELMRNVLINGRLSYTYADYDGISRQDDTLGAGLGVDYLMNRNFSLGFAYDITDKDSSVAGNEYTRNTFGLTLTGKL